MSVKLKTPSNGSVTLAPADTASDVVVTVPAGTSTMVTNATLPTQLNASGSAPIYACRAWVNFDGTGTVAIRGSGNVSSITDLGAGLYQVNFSTAMPDANYAVAASGANSTGTSSIRAPALGSSLATTSFQVDATDAAQSARLDSNNMFVAIFR